ncbi:MAG TPA: cupin domain-containing protein [Hanamia sp.]|nr:cupin domain-containing protein [Hanamia sp.]
MLQTKTSTYIFVFISILFLIACNETGTTSEKNGTDTTSVIVNSDTSTIPAYDPAMEPLTVGAKFIKKIADTLNMKMYEFTLKPGDSAAIHAHPDHTVYVLQGGKLLISINGAAPQEMELKTGTGFVSGSITDAGKNIGTTTIKLLVTDIYRPRVK